MRKSGSGSSILKPQKPRQPLQVVNFDSLSDEGNPPTKIKRRVSFADKKHVKEFCHTTEQGTVWDSTYEEHDCSSKGSLDQITTDESKKISEYISKPEEDVHITVENNPNHSDGSILANNELSELIMRTNEKDNSVISDTDCASPVAYTKHSDNCPQDENIPLPISSLIAVGSPSDDIVVFNDADKESQREIYTSPITQAVSDVPENATPGNIIVYRDFDEEDCVGDDDAKRFESPINGACKLVETCLQNDSMELTPPLSRPMLVVQSYAEERDIATRNRDENQSNGCLHTSHTTCFNNLSMEITQAVRTTEQFAVGEHGPTRVSTSDEGAAYNVRNDATFQTESQTICANDSMMLTAVIPTSAVVNCTNPTRLDTSMDITIAAPGAVLARDVSHLRDESLVTGKDGTERTEYFHDVPMDMTEPINVPPPSVRNKNPRSHEAISTVDGTIFFHNLSMEITRAVSHPGNQKGDTGPVICEEDAQGREVASDPTRLSKDMRPLRESMELTEAVLLYNEETDNRALLVSDTMWNPQSPTRNTELHSVPRADTSSNEPIQSAFLCSTKGVTPNNKSEASIVPENECLSTSRDAIPSPRSSLSPSVQIRYSFTKSINETIQDTEKVITDPVLLTSRDFAKDDRGENVEDENNGLQQSAARTPARETATQENLAVLTETLRAKLTRDKSSDISIDSSSVDSDSSSNDSDRCDESKNSCEKNDWNSMEFQFFQENVCKTSRPDDNCTRERFADTTVARTEPNLRDSSNGSERSFLRKSLPYLENSCDLESIKPPSLVHSEEEISFSDAPSSDQIPTIDDQANKCESSAQLVTNQTAETEHPTESAENVAKDDESFALLNDTKNESMNIENSRTEHRHGNIEETNNAEDKEVDVQQTSEKTNFIDGQSSASSLDTTDRNKQDLGKQIFVSPINATKKLISQSSVEHTQDRVEENLDTEATVEAIVPIKEKPLTEEDQFLLLSQELETCGERDDCIWNVIHKNVDRRMIVFGFMANSLLIVAFLLGDLVRLESNSNKRIKILSRLTDKADVLIRIVHKVLLQKVNAEMLELQENIFSMLSFVSTEVKLAMDFMFDLRRLSDLNSIEITCDKISFVSLSKHMDIILKITIEVKAFDTLTPNDINVHCVLGTVREMEVKDLIKNIKKDYKFLRRYMNDVKNYIDIMEDVTKL